MWTDNGLLYLVSSSLFQIYRELQKMYSAHTRLIPPTLLLTLITVKPADQHTMQPLAARHGVCVVAGGYTEWNLLHYVLPNHSVTGPLYLNALEICCQPQSWYAADPLGSRNVWRYSENLKLGRQTARQAPSEWMEELGVGGRKSRLVSDLKGKLLREMGVWAVGADSNTLSPASPLWEIYQWRKQPWLLFLVRFEAWGDTSLWEGSTFNAQLVMSD